MIDMKYLLVPSMKQKMAKALWGEVSVLNALSVSLVTMAALLLAVVPQLRFCRQSTVLICALSMVKMEAVASNAVSPVSLSALPCMSSSMKLLASSAASPVSLSVVP